MFAVEFHGVDKWFSMPSHRVHSLKETLVNSITRRFSVARTRHQVLRDVSFQVPIGTCLGIIGPNGAGKSTILKLVARVLRPNGGHVVVNGSVSGLLEVGAGFHPDLTGRENVFLYGAILGLSKRRVAQQLESILEFADIGDYIDVPVKNYSSGMYMRVAFAVSVHVNPDILLIDEVLAVGDEAFQQKCLARLDAFKAEGKTIMFVSHDTDLVRRMATRLLLVHPGGSVEMGDPDALLNSYLNSADTAVVLPQQDQYQLEFIRIRDSSGQTRSVVAPGEDVTLTGVIRSERTGTVGLVVTLRSLAGAFVNRARSLDGGVVYPIRPGEQSVEVALSVPSLIPGDYEFSLAVLPVESPSQTLTALKSTIITVAGDPGAQLGVVPVVYRW